MEPKDYSNLRVVIVNNFSGPSIGRYGLRALPLVRGLLDAGARVAVVAAAGSGFAHAAIEAGAEVTAISMSRFRAPQIISAIREAAEEIDANIISGTGYFTNRLVRQAAPDGTKVVNTAARIPDSMIESSVKGLVDIVLRDTSDAYVAISQAVADELIEAGVDADKITVIPNGIDAEAFASAAVEYYGDGAGKMPSRDLKNRPMVFCAARNMDESKGIDVLVDAAVMILQRNPDSPTYTRPNFCIAGSGPEKSIISDFVHSQALSGRIRLIGYAPLIAPWYKACDITVMPSRAEAAAVVALEAMALGKPVIASNLPSIAEVVVDGVTGILIEPDDPELLARTISELLADPDRMKAMGEAGAERVREYFTEQQMIQSYLDLFEQLVRQD
ncbi:MAG: glycosyltransferase family 4 protein [Actinomycetia bacterium]|nr:glycosyltransferase family 4 protein [Actinomycetes bacterium]